jgi:chitinase
VFGQTLRTLYSAATSKPYYISSAPQCPFPDASNPERLLLNCDFVWVQFYNNDPCQIGSAGFSASVEQWSSFLSQSTMAVQPRLYVGVPAYSLAGPAAYAAIGNAEGMVSVASSVVQLDLSNLGGIMLWDGPEGMLNVADGEDIIAWAKQGLET